MKKQVCYIGCRRRGVERLGAKSTLTYSQHDGVVVLHSHSKDVAGLIPKLGAFLCGFSPGVSFTGSFF